MTTTSENCWFITYSGRKFHPLDASPGDIRLVDIAHALSLINRFGGHTVRPYSVAAHSILVCSILPERLQLQGLLHDAAEAYLGDMISPVKEHFPGFKKLEDKLFEVIATRFGLPDKFDPLVKQADLLALRLERDALIRNEGHVWPVDSMTFSEELVPSRPPGFQTARAAEDAFLATYWEVNRIAALS